MNKKNVSLLYTRIKKTKNLLKNKNFLNNQNYVFWKKEKKRLLTKYYIVKNTKHMYSIFTKFNNLLFNSYYFILLLFFLLFFFVFSNIEIFFPIKLYIYTILLLLIFSNIKKNYNKNNYKKIEIKTIKDFL